MPAIVCHSMPLNFLHTLLDTVLSLNACVYINCQRKKFYLRRVSRNMPSCFANSTLNILNKLHSTGTQQTFQNSRTFATKNSSLHETLSHEKFPIFDRFRLGGIMTMHTKNSSSSNVEKKWTRTQKEAKFSHKFKRRWSSERRNAENIPQSGNCVHIGLKLKRTRIEVRQQRFSPDMQVAASVRAKSNRIRFRPRLGPKSKVKHGKVFKFMSIGSDRQGSWNHVEAAHLTPT